MCSSLELVEKHVLTEYGCSQARGLLRSMETMLLQPVLLTLLGRGDGGAAASPQVTSTEGHTSEPQGSWHQGQEVCGSLKLLRILSPDALQTPKITLTLGNNRLSEVILNDN